MISVKGTPFHFAIALQPSTQSCRVICVRDGIDLSSANENRAGCLTRPEISNRHTDHCFFASAA